MKQIVLITAGVVVTPIDHDDSGQGLVEFDGERLYVSTTFGEAQGLYRLIEPVYPDPADVRFGVEYGPNGDDYTGTLSSGGNPNIFGSVWE